MLERLPVVMPDPPAWETEYKQWIMQLKLERGHLRQLPEVLTERKSQASQATVAMMEGADGRAAAVGGKAFRPVPRVTAADNRGDRKTMKRQLDKRVFLVCRNQQGTWEFPATANQQNESIRQTAERALTESLGKQAPIFFIGNAPMAHWQSQQKNATTFFMLAQALLDPWNVNIQQDSDYTDFAWVTKEEIPEYIKDEDLAQLVDSMLSN